MVRRIATMGIAHTLDVEAETEPLIPRILGPGNVVVPAPLLDRLCGEPHFLEGPEGVIEVLVQNNSLCGGGQRTILRGTPSGLTAWGARTLSGKRRERGRCGSRTEGPTRERRANAHDRLGVKDVGRGGRLKIRRGQVRCPVSFMLNLAKDIR